MGRVQKYENKNIKIQDNYNEMILIFDVAVIQDEKGSGGRAAWSILVIKRKTKILSADIFFSLFLLQTHLGGYVKEADNLKDHGIGELVCIAVNDAFVCNAWAKDTKAEGKVI